MTQVPDPEIPYRPPPDEPDKPEVPDEERKPPEDDPLDRPTGPIMEAPGAETGTSMEAMSWNPAKGDRSFGYGAGLAHARRPDKEDDR